MTEAKRALVRQRAGDRCEYCGLSQADSPLAPLHIEHICPRKHGGTDDEANLCLACIDCNLSKGSNLAGYDPLTGTLTPLFHPRRDRWDERFTFEGIYLTGKTPTGRTTVQVLDMNSDDRLGLRAAGDTL